MILHCKKLFCGSINLFGQTRFFARGGIFMEYAFGSSFVDRACRRGKQGRGFVDFSGRYGFRRLTDGSPYRGFHGKIRGASFSISFYAADGRFDLWQGIHLLVHRLHRLR